MSDVRTLSGAMSVIEAYGNVDGLELAKVITNNLPLKIPQGDGGQVNVLSWLSAVNAASCP